MNLYLRFLIFCSLICLAQSLFAQESSLANAPANSEAPGSVPDPRPDPKPDLKKDKRGGSAFAANFENDARVMGGPGTDRAYTNGFKFSYIYSQNENPRWSESPIHLFEFLNRQFQESKSNFSLSFAQQIYTPDNIHTAQPILDDRPYAAWMYLGFGLSFKEPTIARYFELDLGTVGPSALGEQVQNEFHNLIDDPQAQGWTNGLKDEPTLQLFYQQRFRLISKKYYDFIPYFGGGFGNVQIASHVGAIVRLGINIPNDFGPTRPSASDGTNFIAPEGDLSTYKKSLYVFAGYRASATARDIFLDGNSFRQSQHVTKYPFTSDTEVGAGFGWYPITAIWSYVVRSPEFEQQSRFNSFASVTLIYAL